MYRSSELAVILSKSCKILYLSPPNITENCQFNCSVDYVIERAREGGGGRASLAGPISLAIWDLVRGRISLAI